MRRLQSHRRFFAVAAAGVLAGGIAACSSSSSSGSGSGSGSSTLTGKTLIMENIFFGKGIASCYMIDNIIGLPVVSALIKL